MNRTRAVGANNEYEAMLCNLTTKLMCLLGQVCVVVDG